MTPKTARQFVAHHARNKARSVTRIMRADGITRLHRLGSQLKGSVASPSGLVKQVMMAIKRTLVAFWHDYDIALCRLEFRLQPLSGRVTETPGGPGLTHSGHGCIATI
jgi:hypothetical protein